MQTFTNSCIFPHIRKMHILHITAFYFLFGNNFRLIESCKNKSNTGAPWAVSFSTKILLLLRTFLSSPPHAYPVSIFFPINLPWSDGTRCHDLSFWMLSFKPVFSLSSFTFIKRLFSSSSLCAIRLKWQTLFSWAPKITADGDCSHEIERRLLLGRKAMTKLDSVLKRSRITLPAKVCVVKAVVFPVVVYGYESWTIKKAERRRIDAFELWCWRRLFRVSWTAGRANQSILKLISPKYSLEGLMLKLKLQYFGHLMWRANSLEKTLMLGKIEGRRRRGQQTMRWLDGITIQWTWVWTNSGR